MNINFDNKIVVVSGAAMGLGRRFVEDFLTLGARVYCCDVTAEGLEVVKQKGAETMVLDLTDRASTKDWITRIEDGTGRAVDILVNNAGGHAHAVSRRLEDVLDSEWDVVMAINPGTAFSLSRAAVPGMKRAGYGRIVNISSGAGIAASHSRLHPYTAAKHAVVGLTRQMADELGEFGITVNCVAPGLVISSDFSQQHWDKRPEEVKNDHLKRTFMRRTGKPSDISDAVLFLASDHASWISGQVLSVNGGMR